MGTACRQRALRLFVSQSPLGHTRDMLDLFSESLAGRALFAIPKKGRLYEKCLELLAGADIQFTRSHRLDVCLVRNHNMALVFLPAADIPRFVGEGNVDLGITGQDMVAEASTTLVYPSQSLPGTPANDGSSASQDLPLQRPSTYCRGDCGQQVRHVQLQRTPRQPRRR